MIDAKATNLINHFKVIIMKANSFITGLILILSLTIFPTLSSAKDVVLITTRSSPINHPTNPTRAPQYIPVNVLMNESELTVIFDYSVGEATITIEDESGMIWVEEVVDTDDTLVAYLWIEDLDPGQYTIKISYGDVSFSGTFIKE